MIVITDNSRELTEQENETVISVFSFQNRVLYFQQGDGNKLTEFTNQLFTAQNVYNYTINQVIDAIN